MSNEVRLARRSKNMSFGTKRTTVRERYFEQVVVQYIIVRMSR